MSSSPDVLSVSSGDRRNVWNSVHLGASFCMVFMAFSVSQNFQTSSDHKEQGSTALGILYACFTLSNFVSSFVVSTIGSKLAIFLGSLTYVAFVAANIQYQMEVLYVFSALLGVGASTLWTAQGAYISNCSALHERAHGLPSGSTLGYFNGIFFSLFQTNMIIGSLVAALLFKKDVAVSTIFVVMTCIGGTGAVTLMFLRDPAKAMPLRGGYDAPSASPSGMGDQLTNPSSSPHLPDSYSELLFASASSEKRTGCGRVLSVFESLKMLVEPRMIVLLPIMIYSGLSQTYIFGDVPPLLEDRSTKYFMLAVLGACDALSSIAMGKISDKHGRVIVLAIGFVTAAASIIFLGLWKVNQDDTYIFFLVAMVLGISDGVFNTQIYAILGCWFEGRAEMAFANFKLFQAGSTAVAFLVNNVIGFHWKCVMTGSALVVGILALTAYDLMHRLQGRGGPSVLDTAPASLMDDYAEGSASPMLQSQTTSAFSSPQLHGHASFTLNAKERADSLALDHRHGQAPMDL